MDAQGYIEDRGELVNRWLDALVPPAGSPPQRLNAAMRHLLFPGGKRLRPAFAMAAAEAVGSAPEVALPAAAAVELIHTYSLIHDDLPCMDDDDVRRGAPTVHVAFDEATAVLAGDALQALAFEALASVGAVGAMSQRAALAVRDLARAVGGAGLVGGQVDDVAAEIATPVGGASSTPLTQSELESIHSRKSAALIAVAVSTGARLAGAEGDALERLYAFGVETGVAFQIVDDVLDGDGVAALLGSEAARVRAEELLSRALERIEDLGDRAESLRELARFAVRRAT